MPCNASSKIPQPSEGLYYALLRPPPAGNQRCASTRRSPRQLPKPSFLLRIPNAARCRSAGSCVSLPTNTSVPVEKLHASPFSSERPAQKSHKKITAVGTRVAQDKYASRRKIKKHGRPSSSRRRPAELRRRLAAGRKTKPVRRGQALRVSPRTPVTLLPVEPLADDDAAAGRRFSCWSVRG